MESSICYGALLTPWKSWLDLPGRRIHGLSAGDMTTTSNLTSQGWKDDRIFTGRDPCYPVELFIELLEGESKIFDFHQDRLAANAKCLVDVDSGNLVDSSWDTLKAGLLGAFGRGGVPYTSVDHVMLVKSLTKGKVESYNTFYLR